MVRPKLGVFYCFLFVGLWGMGAGPAAGQIDYGTRLGQQYRGATSFAPQGGSGVLLDALEPAVRRWYVPQELFQEYAWRQWEYTNYARAPYERYVDAALEGDYFYDLYGNFLNQGWLIYNTEHTQPEEFGTVLFKAQRFSQWFNEVVVASDSKGQYNYALTVSGNLRSTFTPMVLSKPRLNGIQLDIATDKYRSTLIYSLVSSPRGTQQAEQRWTDMTALLGARLTAQLGDFVEMGFHTISAHQSNSLAEELVKTRFEGALTQGQNQTITSIRVVLRDDSPEDGVGGAAFFQDASDIIITYRDGRVDTGKDLRFEPLVEGGIRERGFLAANGTEEISLLYDFDSAGFVNRASAGKEEIVKVEFQLAVANDYQIWVTSDRQVGRVEPVLLLATQANGNVQDISNLRIVGFEYGLPTATHVLGGTLKAEDVMGFDLYSEYDLSWSYRQYPNPLEETHRTASGIRGERNAAAWMVNAARAAGPFFFFGESYSMDPRYNTQSFVNISGGIDYGSEGNLVDLVEDNDDQDRIPDSFRADWIGADLQVFPGWDLNNDFIPDYNQNDNRIKPNTIPDYEEPFLRFRVDRPEFLFGVDMNNNFWVDQYENDEEPDYPYRKDHRGFNGYGGVHLTPSLRLMAGALRAELISSDKQNHSTYAVLSFDDSYPRFGRVRIFEMSKLVEDDIPNPLLQWVPDNTVRIGGMARVEDPLMARDTWVNQLFAGHSWRGRSLYLTTKMNYVLFHQRMDKAERRRHNLDATDYFFGLINKASYRYDLGRVALEPRWKSEFRKQTRSLFAVDSQTTLTELLSTLAELKVLRATSLQAGLEYVIFNDFDEDANDSNSLTTAFQVSSQSEYLGYRIRALAGVVIERRDFKEVEATTTTQSFITLYAGLQ